MVRKILALALIAVFAQLLIAQEAQRAPQVLRPQPCPHPYSQTLSGGTGASSPDITEFPANIKPSVAGSTWNQTQTDKHFGHTFRFPAASDCCVITSGTLRVTLKALNSGGVGASGANNDAVHIYSAGAYVPGISQQPWVQSGVTAGTTVTVTIQIPPSVLATGKATFYVQDDTAVTGATLTLEGCCIRKQQ